MATGSYFWLVALDPYDKRQYLIPGGKTEQIAREKGIECLSGIDFQVRMLPTTNLAKASQLLKGNRLEKTKSLHKAAERLGHERSLERAKLRKDKSRRLGNRRQYL